MITLQTRGKTVTQEYSNVPSAILYTNSQLYGLNPWFMHFN